MTPGVQLYWIGEDRTSGPDCRTWVLTGRYVYDCGGTYVIQVEDPAGRKEAAFVEVDRRPVFPDPAQADAYALGQALRLMALFNFQTATVTTTKGIVTLNRPECLRDSTKV